MSKYCMALHLFRTDLCFPSWDSQVTKCPPTSRNWVQVFELKRQPAAKKLSTEPTEHRKAGNDVPFRPHQTGTEHGFSCFPFFPTPYPNSCSIRLSCCPQLLPTAANTAAIILQIPLLATGLRDWLLNITCFPQRGRECYWQEVKSRTAAACTLTDSCVSTQTSNEFTF